MSPTVPQYLFEVTLCLGVFYGFYALALRRETFFRFNRIYLLLSPVLSFLIPALDLSVSPEQMPLAAELWLPSLDLAEVMQAGMRDRLAPYLANWRIRPSDLLFLIYFLGVAILSFRFLDELWEIFGLIRRFPVRKTETGHWVQGTGRPTASFFGFFFYHRKQLDERDRMILAHERAHIRQWHSLDVVLMECMVILKWFNPLIYLFRRQLRLTHEFIADRYVVRMYGKPTAYQQLLRTVRQEKKGSAGPASPFAAYSDERLEMLSKRSATWSSGKILLLFPILLLLMSLFSFNWLDRQPIGQDIRHIAVSMDRLSRQPLLSFQGIETEESPELLWSIHRLPLTAVKKNGSLGYEVQRIDPHFFRDLQHSQLFLEQAGKLLEIAHVKARIAIGSSEEIWEAASSEMFFKQLQALPVTPELTLYLRIRDEQDRSWMAIVAITQDDRVYGDQEAVVSLWEEAANLQWRLGAQQRTIMIPTKKEAAFFFRWGNIEAPIELYANPQVYSGYVEVSREDLESTVGADLKFMENGVTLAIESLRLSLYDQRLNTNQVWRPEIEGNYAHFRHTDKAAMILETVRPGDNLIIFGRIGDKLINTINIRILDPNGLFQPLVEEPRINREPAEYEFQVISREGERTRLKIDTTKQDTRHILEMYRDRDRFEIIHVPDFRTRERLITENKRDAFLQFAGQAENPFYTDYLPEYTDYADKDIRLHWGEMFAIPNSLIYAYEEFLDNRQSDMSLWVGDTVLRLKKATVMIYPKDGAISGFQMHQEDFSHPGKSPEFLKIQPGASLFFRNIAVSDEAGKEYYFPVGFVFNIGHSHSEDPDVMVIEELGSGAYKPEKIVSEDKVTFHNYALSALIAELTGKKLNRIVFESMPYDPILKVELKGKGYSPGGAYEIILNALEKKYGFRAEWERIPKEHWRIQIQYPDRLEQALYEGEDGAVEKVRIFDPEGFHLFTGITLYELADYLEDHFDTIFGFYPNRYGSERFIFGLDFSNFESVRRQLREEYGIEFFEGNTLYNGLKVRFFEDPK